jgi:hypothetical protein
MSPYPITLALAAAAGAILAACGGGDPEEPGGAPLLFDGVQVLMPLFADDGSALPSDPALMPAEASLRTRHARYARRTQAEWIDGARPGEVIWTDLGCCEGPGVADAEALAHVLQLAQGLPADAPVFVSGGSAAQAARVADALHDAGRTQVWLVVD